MLKNVLIPKNFLNFQHKIQKKSAMKIVLSNIVIVLIYLISFNVSAQYSKIRQPVKQVVYNDNVNKPLTVLELNQLKEVYGDDLDKDILNRPQRLKDIKNILRNRVEIVNIPNVKDQKPCKLLSEVPLFDAYVNSLKRDEFFNKNSFNPLKYVFAFYSRGASIYKVDNTNYFIIIKSQHQK